VGLELMKLVYEFPELVKGKLIKRYKRFFADIELNDGHLITAHCPNTGPMTGICEIGNEVAVSHQPSPKRKLAYTWEMICMDGTWVGVNTSLPNRVVGGMLRQGILPQFARYPMIRSEVPYGNEGSRIDFLLSDVLQRQVYIEVKNTTWSDGRTAIFPDTETTRGQKHLRELMVMAGTPARAVIVYFIHRGDCDRFRSGDEADPIYGELLRKAVRAGVEVLPLKFQVDMTGIYYLGTAQFICGQD
jgi:sugar fermentation stimulation protein A